MQESRTPGGRPAGDINSRRAAAGWTDTTRTGARTDTIWRRWMGNWINVKYPLYDIYESKSQISRKKFDFLQDRTKRTTIRDLSKDFDIFRQNAKNPYTIYTNQNHKYHAENLIFYSIEQKGLFTDPGRRADSPQSTPMGSRCLLFLLSVNACGSSQGESRRKSGIRTTPAAVCQRVREIHTSADRPPGNGNQNRQNQVRSRASCQGFWTYWKSKRTPFSLATAAGFQITALRQADREPMGALCGGCLLASGRDNVEDSQQAPAGFHTGKIPCRKFLQG